MLSTYPRVLLPEYLPQSTYPRVLCPVSTYPR